MISKSQRDITANVVSTAENLEEYGEEMSPEYGGLSPLEVKVEASIDGTLREITLVLQTGGPQIEVNLASETVAGFSGSDYHKTHFKNDDLTDMLWEYWTEQYEENR